MGVLEANFDVLKAQFIPFVILGQVLVLGAFLCVRLPLALERLKLTIELYYLVRVLFLAVNYELGGLSGAI